jgi:hypothetical protein
VLAVLVIFDGRHNRSGDNGAYNPPRRRGVVGTSRSRWGELSSTQVSKFVPAIFSLR